MTFGPNTTNPRERRAYADAMLACASRSGSVEDFKAAQAAIRNVGNSAISNRQAANFAVRLVSAALKDPTTRTIVDVFRSTLDMEQTPPQPHCDGHYVQMNQRRSGLGAHEPGGVVIQSSWHELGGTVVAIGDITVTVCGDPREYLGKAVTGYVIPKVAHDAFDPVIVRLMSEDTRQELGAAVARVDRCA